ncbi:hypothetical protein GOP47_0018468 [Adiantum capillus-veneris]|uniref:Uncharacterized protein n=1 Tax=Adiantum capillus-veneris TaxID=13818 RepID=A0A9D4Z8T3_ADICA|nr:hypothetical protein GOP47_0018468 [Adiantum capillus-veneris]
MREFPSCFGEYGVQVADSFASGANRGTQNVVTCFYKSKLAGVSRMITVTWCKTLGGQGLSVNVHDTSSECTFKLDMKPWLFWKKKGSKTLYAGELKVEVFWDLSSAKYGSGPEPIEGFYLAIASGCKISLLLGDMAEEAYKRALSSFPPVGCTDTSLISRREHVFGKTFYSTRAQFRDSGRSHDILIECQTVGKEPRLCVRVDKQLVVQVKRLMWKFRGNQTIMVDGCPVELLWDVHNWLFNPSDNPAVFMFQTGLPSPPTRDNALGNKHNIHSSTSYYQWHQHTVSSSSTGKCQDGYGFSLLLYAWKSE